MSLPLNGRTDFVASPGGRDPGSLPQSGRPRRLLCPWFGNDLAAGNAVCPMVESAVHRSENMPWQVRARRGDADVMRPAEDDRPVYGGKRRRNASVIEGDIHAMNGGGEGSDVLPVHVLMDPLDGKYACPIP